MKILKHVKYRIKDTTELERLINHINNTSSKVNGVEFKDIFFLKSKNEFVLEMMCVSEEKYLEWRDICPPPPGARDWYEVLLTKQEYFQKVNNPDILALKPEPTELAKTIFQETCSVENMEAKFGKTLSKKENDVKNFILTQSPILGRIPSINEINKSFSHFPLEKLVSILNKLDQFDVIHLDNDRTTIMAAYPFSGSETAHIVTLKREGYKKIYAMCAIDALGICFMFNCDVSIDSMCNHCGEKIYVEIKDNKIISLKPKNTLVWCDREYSCCAATSLCKNTNFFYSERHFAEWRNNNPNGKGNLLEITEAFYLGKLFFENRLKNK